MRKDKLSLAYIIGMLVVMGIMLFVGIVFWIPLFSFVFDFWRK